MMKHPANTDAEAARRVEAAAEALRRGSGILLTDDEDRENEGDLIFPAESISIAQMAQLIRHCSGIVCLCITSERARSLDLPLMVRHNTNRQGTNFTVSVEATSGVTTASRQPTGSRRSGPPSHRMPGRRTSPDRAISFRSWLTNRGCSDAADIRRAASI